MELRVAGADRYAKDDDPYAQAAAYFGLTVNQADLCFGWDR